jgi:hypothetical protein
MTDPTKERPEITSTLAALCQRVTQLERRILTLEEQASPDRGPRIGG